MTQQILITISALIIISYLFDILAKWIKIPSVIFLLSSGVIIKIFWDALGMPAYDVKPLLELFGTVGLILIVLEGSLDLELSKSKLPLIKTSLISSSSFLILASIAIGFILQYFKNTKIIIPFILGFLYIGA